MSLQFIIGSSGAGKSYHAFGRLIQEALAEPSRQFYVIVPEQFTMQTQKTLVEMHPGGGILNIDVLSFQRLAYRIFEEVGEDMRNILEDTGKSMVILRVVQQHQKELPYLGSRMKKTGYIDEVKSLLSEFMQYGIHEDELSEVTKTVQPGSLLDWKLRDISTIYTAFTSYLKDHYVTAEEVLDVLLTVLPSSSKIKDSTMVFDGFTGFTPVQLSVLQELLVLCRQVRVTVTMDPNENLFERGKSHQLFYMSHQMITSLSKRTKQIDPPVLLRHDRKGRFQNAPALRFLEEQLFRYRRASFPQEPQQVQCFCADTPTAEMEETVRRICQLVREKGYRYGEIAVITGNLEEYSDIAVQAFAMADIPCFIDEKHNCLMNSYVEWLRSSMEMVAEDLSYASVFRFLRSGMTNFTMEEIDRLENYVLALGIRGWKNWNTAWVRTYRGLAARDLLSIGECRQAFVQSISALVEAFRGGPHTVREYCVALYEFSVQNQTQEKLKRKELGFAEAGRYDLEKEYAQIYGIVMQLLDKMVEILGEEKMSRKDFIGLLEAGLAQTKIGLIPASIDQVLVGDMERTRLKDVRALFFVGVNEGNIPKNTQSGGFLTETDREFFEEKGIALAPGPKERMGIGRFYLYLNLTKPSSLLCLSYCYANSKGDALRPAYLIDTMQTLFPKLSIQKAGLRQDAELPRMSLRWFLHSLREDAHDNHAYFWELYGWYLRSSVYSPLVRKLVEASFSGKPKDFISRAVAEALYGEISPYSATRMERYCACAYMHFLQYGLRLTERVEYEFHAMDMGNVMHEALERFSEQLRQKGLTWRDATPETLTSLAEECVDVVTADYGNTILKSSSRNLYMIDRTKRILVRTVKILQKQLQNGSFEPEGFELAFEGGRIDRIDIDREDGKILVKVIDYKTGNTSFDLAGVYHGLQLQLMIYLDAALQTEAEKYPDCEISPAGIFYYNIKDPFIEEALDADEKDVEGKLQKALKMNGLVQADKEVIQKLDQTLVSLPVDFTKDGEIQKRSSVATRRQFAMLGDYVKEKIQDSISKIMDGSAELSPYDWKNRNPCMYCAYREACGFDRKLPGFTFRALPDFPDEEVWKRIEREISQVNQ